MRQFDASDVSLSDRETAAIVRSKRRIEIEGDLVVARLQLQRIDEELVGYYGEIATIPVKELRRILSNIAYIVNPIPKDR